MPRDQTEVREAGVHDKCGEVGLGAVLCMVFNMVHIGLLGVLYLLVWCIHVVYIYI